MINFDKDYYDEEELQELSDLDDMDEFTVILIGSDEETIEVTCLGDNSLIRFREDEYTDDQYHKMVIYDGLENEDFYGVKNGNVISVYFNESGIAESEL